MIPKKLWPINTKAYRLLTIRAFSRILIAKRKITIRKMLLILKFNRNQGIPMMKTK
jgi:hypothetical protein